MVHEETVVFEMLLRLLLQVRQASDLRRRDARVMVRRVRRDRMVSNDHRSSRVHRRYRLDRIDRTGRRRHVGWYEVDRLREDVRRELHRAVRARHHHRGER